MIYIFQENFYTASSHWVREPEAPLIVHQKYLGFCLFDRCTAICTNKLWPHFWTDLYKYYSSMIKLELGHSLSTDQQTLAAFVTFNTGGIEVLPSRLEDFAFETDAAPCILPEHKDWGLPAVPHYAFRRTFDGAYYWHIHQNQKWTVSKIIPTTRFYQTTSKGARAAEFLIEKTIHCPPLAHEIFL